MGYTVAPRERGVVDRGYERRIDYKTLDELSAAVVESQYRNFSSYYSENNLSGQSVKFLLSLGDSLFEKFRSQPPQFPLTKYRFAEAFMNLYAFLSVLEKNAGRAADGGLLESYIAFAPDPKNFGQALHVSKLRPWTDPNIRALREYPAFSVENLNTVQAYLVKTTPGLIQYDEPAALKEVPPTKPSVKPLALPTPEVIPDKQAEKKEEAISVTIKPTKKLVTQVTNEKAYNYNEIRDEILALAISALTSDREMKLRQARDIARRYANKYLPHANPAFSDHFFVDIDGLREHFALAKHFNPDNKANTGIQYDFPVHLSAYSVLNFHYDFRVEMPEDLIKLLNGTLQKELTNKYALDRIQENLDKYFRTMDPKDFEEVVHSVTSSRYLMVQYLEDDYIEKEAKRNSLFFRAFEAALYDHGFPADDRAFFREIAGRIRSIHELIRNGKIEAAIVQNKLVHEQYLKIKEKLDAYERDKQKWGRRALMLLTLALELLITYLTSGLIRAIPARAGFLVNLIVPAIKQEIYLQSGMIEKRNFRNLAIEAATGVTSIKIATNISQKLTVAYNIPMGRFKRIVIDNLLVNFTAALQQELVHLLRKQISIDDFLSELFKNFVTGVMHEKAATIAINRIKTSPLDALIRKKDPSVIELPDRHLNQKMTNASKGAEETVQSSLKSGQPEDHQLTNSRAAENRQTIGIPVKKPSADEIHPQAIATISQAPRYAPRVDLSLVAGVGLGWMGRLLRYSEKEIADAINTTATDVKKGLRYLRKAHGIKEEDMDVNPKGEVFAKIPDRQGGKTRVFVGYLQDAIAQVHWKKQNEALQLQDLCTQRFGAKGAALIMEAIENRHKLREAMDLPVRLGQAHHLIPVEVLKNNPVVQAAVVAGFKFNGRDNGLPLPWTIHLRAHDEYNFMIGRYLSIWASQNKNYTPAMARQFIEQTLIPKYVAFFVNGGAPRPVEK